MSPRQRLHLVPVVRVEALLELGHLGVVRPRQAGVAGVARARQHLLGAAAKRRRRRQLVVELGAHLLTAELRQLGTLTSAQLLQLSINQSIDRSIEQTSS